VEDKRRNKDCFKLKKNNLNINKTKTIEKELTQATQMAHP